MDRERKQIEETNITGIKKEFLEPINPDIDNEKLLLELENEIFNNNQILDEEVQKEKQIHYINEVKNRIADLKDSYTQGKINLEQTKDLVEDLLNVLLIRLDIDSQDENKFGEINIDEEIINPIKDFLYNEWKNKNN